MPNRLKTNAKGGYRFLPAIEPYCSGVIAEPGFEIVHVTLARALPWSNGLVSVRRFLEEHGCDRHALCGVELRCHEPHSMDGFIAFNRDYCALLDEWDMLIDGDNPVARTNVAPVVDPPDETTVHGFSYTERSDIGRPTFVVAGGGELPHRNLDADRIIRSGETSDDAMLEKARCVIDIMQRRLDGLEVTDDLISTVNVYTAHRLHSVLADVLIPALPAAARLGIRWSWSRPPVRDIEFEMDIRGVCRDVVIDLT